MKAYYLVRHGAADKAFELRDLPELTPKVGEVLIQSEAFGLNFADVMARMGLYQDAPPLPAVLGYETVGRITALGAGVTHLQVGQRVVALTRFGGYAQAAIADARAAMPIPEDMDAAVATALATQYATAWYAAEEAVRIHEGDHVLIHAAAGGVGVALTQIAKRRGAILFGTAGSDEKLKFLKEQGVDYPINYRKVDFAQEIKRLGFDKKLDVVYDPIGGNSFKKGFKLLNAGGRLVGYGASTMTEAKGNPFKMLGVAKGFGIWSPIELLTNSKSLLGVNMLRIADNKPEILGRCIKAVVELTEAGVLNPIVGKTFPHTELAQAHEYLASRQSVGKVAVLW
ncbi:medium chain dehydrogenase/reductase family protein [soil metagenome]